MTATVGDLLTLVAVIAIGFLIAVAFYESLCERDVVLARAMGIAHRITARRWVHVLTYVASVAIVIPALIVVWISVLDLAFFFLGSTDSIKDAGVIAAAIVGAARVLAYVRQRTSHELAKAIPLALAFVAMTGGSFHLEEKIAILAANPGAGAVTTEMVLVIVALELGLRLLTVGSNATLSAFRRRRGITSDAGIWRSVRQLIRRPFGDAIEAAAAAHEDRAVAGPGPRTP
jgi:hypothetical protein